VKRIENKMVLVTITDGLLKAVDVFPGTFDTTSKTLFGVSDWLDPFVLPV